jgi:hypothetical protein
LYILRIEGKYVSLVVPKTSTWCATAVTSSITSSERVKARGMGTVTKGRTTISEAIVTTTEAHIVFRERSPKCDPAALFGLTQRTRTWEEEDVKMKMMWRVVMKAKPPGPKR